MITVVVKEPGKQAQPKQIDGSVESIQAEVGGYFEVHRLDRFTLYVNEDGKMRYMPSNIVCGCHGAVLVGNVVGMQGDKGLKASEVNDLREMMNARAVLGAIN